MIVVFSPQQAQHAPAFEFYRGERVRCFETPERADFVLAELTRRGYALQPPEVDSRATLARVHTAGYLDFLESAWGHWLALDPANADRQPFPSVWPVRTLRSDVEPDNFIARLGLYSMDNGCPLVAGTWAAAKAGADAAATAAALLRAGASAVFCATRPPGHHAGADFMGGYCYLNNAAVAAQALLDAGAGRVAILDLDYHHGNGTQSLFYERDDVLTVSLHGDPRSEYPFYLGHADETGAGDGAGYNLNLPLPAGCQADAWFGALGTACARVQAERPAALVVSLGLDTYAGDPISSFSLQSADYLTVGARLRALDMPTLFILEGGYATAALGINAANVLDGFKAG